MRILLLSLIIFLAMNSYASAFFKDIEIKDDDKEISILEKSQYKSDRKKMIERRKYLIERAGPIRKKRKETLTPFISQISEQKLTANTKILKQSHPKKFPISKTPGTKNSTNKTMMSQIIPNMAIIGFYLIGFIFFIRYLRKKII